MKDAPQFPHAFRNTKGSRRGEKKKICLSSKAVVRSYKVALMSGFVPSEIPEEIPMFFFTFLKIKCSDGGG